MADLSSVDTHAHAHVVEVEELSLVNHAGEEVDIRPIFIEIDVENSIFDPGIQGTILIYDAVGLINRLPIIGEERLKISYKTPGNRSKKGEFVIWKISEEHPDPKGNSSTYRLHFCGQEMIANGRNNLAKSYTNTDQALEIVREILGTYLESGKELRTREPTIKDPAKVLVIPYYSPFEAIDMVRRRAYTERTDSSNYFLFFERWDSWYFTTLDSLVEDPINNRETDTVEGESGGSPLPDTESWKESWWSYASDKFIDDSIHAKDIRRVSVMRIVSRFNTIEKVTEGAYDNEVVQYSIVDKALYSNTFNFAQQGKVTMGGSKDPFDTDSPRGSEEKNTPNTDQFLSITGQVDSGFAGGQAPKVYFRLKDPEEKDGVVKKAGGAYRSTRVLLNQIQISVTVPGDTMVDVGDIIHLVIPRFDSMDDTQPDKFLYGKYVVGAVRDSILSPDKHVMSVDLYRDGFWKKIGPSEGIFEES